MQEEQEKEEEEEDSEDPCTHIRHEIQGHQDTIRSLRDSLSKIDSETARLREVDTLCICTYIIRWHDEIKSLGSTLSLARWWDAIQKSVHAPTDSFAMADFLTTHGRWRKRRVRRLRRSRAPQTQL